MTSQDPNPSIAVLAYPGAQMSAVLGLQDLFTIANRDSERRGGIRLTVVEVSEDSIQEAALGRFDAVVLPPSLENARGDSHTTLQDWLRAQHASGALMCSVSCCVGMNEN